MTETIEITLADAIAERNAALEAFLWDERNYVMECGDRETMRASKARYEAAERVAGELMEAAGMEPDAPAYIPAEHGERQR